MVGRDSVEPFRAGACPQNGSTESRPICFFRLLKVVVVGVALAENIGDQIENLFLL
jgi:hypothetical protein